MEYTSHQLCKMSGVSARTLRHYDAIGLLKPMRVASTRYRIYGSGEADLLQQILIYRELGFPLADIKELLSNPGFDRVQAFTAHLASLYDRRARLDTLIGNVAKSISHLKGETTMNDTEKFEGFKQALVAENERKYGAEIRAKYGEQEMAASNARVTGLTQEQYDESERLRLALEETLSAAFATGAPAGALAQEACELHKQWLCILYPKYSKEYHRALGEMYVADNRFRTNYDKLAPGCTEFLRDAIRVYCA